MNEVKFPSFLNFFIFYVLFPFWYSIWSNDPEVEHQETPCHPDINRLPTKSCRSVMMAIGREGWFLAIWFLGLGFFLIFFCKLYKFIIYSNLANNKNYNHVWYFIHHIMWSNECQSHLYEGIQTKWLFCTWHCHNM